MLMGRDREHRAVVGETERGVGELEVAAEKRPVDLPAVGVALGRHAEVEGAGVGLVVGVAPGGDGMDGELDAVGVFEISPACPPSGRV